MDKLKEYLLGHKPDLDVDSPAGDTWESIESRMADETRQKGAAAKSVFRPKSGFSSSVLRYAVAACVIALAGAGLWLVVKNYKAPSDTSKQNSATVKGAPAPEKEKAQNTLRRGEKTPGNDMAGNGSEPKKTRHKTGPPKPVESPDEVDIIDRSYSRLIAQELRKLRATPLYAENGNYFSFYVEQLKQMDQDERAVRNDIKAYGLTSEFLEQLINVYQQKLNVLKDLRTEINKMNNKIMEKQAPSGKPQIHYLNL